jgi:hypothetical protein
MRRPTDEDIWRNRIETSDICKEELGEPMPIRHTPKVDYVYLFDYLEPWKDTDSLYNIVDFGNCIKCFRLKSPAINAKFYINGTVVTIYRNLAANTWYDFHYGYSVSNVSAPGFLRYLEIEYEIQPETKTIEISYIQLVGHSAKYKDHVNLGTYGSI